MAAKQRLATQVDAELLAQTRAIASREGRLLQSIVEEALIDLLAKRRGEVGRPHVAAAYGESVAEFGQLYDRLSQ